MATSLVPQQPGHAPGWKWRQDSAGAIEVPWPADMPVRSGGLCESGWHTDCPQSSLPGSARSGQCACLCHQTCQWFALCDHPTSGDVAHPVLGSVPTCTRCAERLDLTFVNQES